MCSGQLGLLPPVNRKWVVAYLLWGTDEGLVWLTGAVVCLIAAPWVQLSVSTDNGRPHNALWHHWFMPISCHFRDCKALLVASIPHVSSAVTNSNNDALYLCNYNYCNCNNNTKKLTNMLLHWYTNLIKSWGKNKECWWRLMATISHCRWSSATLQNIFVLRLAFVIVEVLHIITETSDRWHNKEKWPNLSVERILRNYN